MSGPASMCIIFKCHVLLYVELNKIHIYMYSYGIDKESTIFCYDLIAVGIENNNLHLSYRTHINICEKMYYINVIYSVLTSICVCVL